MDHAHRCRALAARARTGALATVARDPPGFPFASLVAVAFDEVGRPLLLLSALAEHTANLASDPKASLMVHDAADQPLAAERMTVVGTCAPVPAAEVPHARAVYLAAQPGANAFAGFADFALYRLEPRAVRYVGGFGRMSWVELDAYRSIPGASGG